MAGYYTEITTLFVYPTSAAPGDRVDVEIYVKNIWDQVIPYLWAWAWQNSSDIDVGGYVENTYPGITRVFAGHFTMPDHDVTVTAASYYWDGTQWIQDDVAYRTVTVEAPPEEYTLAVVIEPSGFGFYTKDPLYVSYLSGTTVTVTVTPYTGYQFVGWSGDASGTSPTIEVLMDSDKQVIATFEPVPVEEFAGTISRKELEYDHVKSNIPVS